MAAAAAATSGTSATSDGQASVTVLHGNTTSGNSNNNSNNQSHNILTPQNIVLNRLAENAVNNKQDFSLNSSGLNTQAIITSIANNNQNNHLNSIKEEKINKQQQQQPDINMVYQMLKQLERRIDSNQKKNDNENKSTDESSPVKRQKMQSSSEKSDSRSNSPRLVNGNSKINNSSSLGGTIGEISMSLGIGEENNNLPLVLKTSIVINGKKYSGELRAENELNE